MIDIWLYIADDSAVNADNFVDQLQDKFPLIATQPEMGVRRDDLEEGLRAFYFRNYAILYRFQGEFVEIARVLHGAQKIDDLF